MNEIGHAIRLALSLVTHFEPEFVATVLLSFEVSLAAAAIGFAFGAPLGALLAVARFPGQAGVVILIDAALGLPSVVVGLLVYLAFSKSGPFGAFSLLFTPVVMTLAQSMLVFPIVLSLVHRFSEGLWFEYGGALNIDGASHGRAAAMLLAMSQVSLVTVFLAAFGRAIAEVGAILMVGGNIRGFTRTMTTTIALDTSEGDLALALGLGMVLLLLSFVVSVTASAISQVARRR